MDKVRLGDVATYINGYAFKPEDWGDKGRLIIRIQDLTGNGYQANRFDGTIPLKYNVTKGDVLISWSASLGIYVWQGEDAVLNQHIFKVVFDKVTVNKDFFIYQVSGLLKKATNEAHGATMKHLTKPVFDALPFALPNPEEQNKIAKSLNLLHSIIEFHKQQLDTLDALIKARFVEMFGDPVSNPNEWKTAPLDRICDVIVDCPHSTPSYTKEDTGFMCIRTSTVKKNQILWNEVEFIPEIEYIQRIQRKRPEKGDIVYTREGAILGIAAIIDRDCNVSLGQRSMLLSPNLEKSTPEFLCTAMNCDSFLHNALKGQSGSASPHINVGDIKAFGMIVPPIEVQRQFSLFSQQVDKSKSVVQKALDEAQLLFDSLMQKYFG